MLLIEENFQTEVLSEDVGGKKNWFISGIFMQSDVVNRNRRNYPAAIMEKAVGEYDRNFVKTKRAMGELNHPTSIQINPERASHVITEIKRDGKNFIGKARILRTPMGNVVSGLLEGGVVLGVSSRGTGSVISEGGIDVVQPDFGIAAIDVVANPSANEAFVQGLMEGKEFVWNTLEEDVALVERIKSEVMKAKSKNLQEAKIVAFQKFMNRLKGN